MAELGFVLLFLSCLALVVDSAPNENASPWPLTFSTNGSVGPDGPWPYIELPFGSPDKYVAVQLSQATETIVVPLEACQDPTSSCSLPLPYMWEDDNMRTSTYSANDSDTVGATTLNTLMSPLGLNGTGHNIEDTIVLSNGGNLGYLNQSAMTAADNFTVSYPGGAKYTMMVGFLSLNGGANLTKWTSKSGKYVWGKRPIPKAYDAGYIPSVSYGLHLGSVSQNIPGSLHLGGYDSSRFLSDPIISENNVFSISEISLGVSSGASAFQSSNGSVMSNVSDLLRPHTDIVTPLTVLPNPGVPYLYLPQSTCDAIASYLPVTFSSAYNLYLWNTSEPRFERIVTSPHNLIFSFLASSAATDTRDVSIPFALLNLTLDRPISSTPVQYFPCSPYLPNGATDPVKNTFHLGRAFLQGAAIAQNWQTNKSWLAQAPGPKLPSSSVKALATDDTTLAGMANPPSWESTWEGVLTPLTSETSSSGRSSGGLSSGAKAGIGIGVALGVLAVLGVGVFCLSRRKRNRGPAMPERERPVEIGGAYISELGDVAYHPVEMIGYDFRNVRYKQPESTMHQERGVLPVELPPDSSSRSFR